MEREKRLSINKTAHRLARICIDYFSGSIIVAKIELNLSLSPVNK